MKKHRQILGVGVSVNEFQLSGVFRRVIRHRDHVESSEKPNRRALVNQGRNISTDMATSQAPILDNRPDNYTKKGTRRRWRQFNYCLRFVI